MASAATIEQLINYYVGLLIIQYANQPRAQAHIALIIGELVASGVMLDVMNGYNLTGDDTAVGVQLDVLGKYAGVTRYWAQEDLTNFFAFTTYTEMNPDALPKFGFSTYATYGDYDYNGTLTYDSIVETQNSLGDADFLTLILAAILRNTCQNGWGEIDQKIWNLFGTSIRPESNGGMKMFYIISTAITPLIQALILQKILPNPMGVQLTYVQQNAGLIFGFTDYTGIEQPFEYGFSDYADYSTLPGQTLTYDQIIAG